MWGVGTRLVTAFDQPALGGVYKLGAIRDPGGAWQHRIKLSEQAAKISTPGVQQVRRFLQDGVFVGDMIHDTSEGAEPSRTMIDPFDPTRRRTFAEGLSHEDLLAPIYRGGRKVYAEPSIHEARERTRAQVASLHPTIRRFDNPHSYPVGLEQALHALRTRLVLEARGLDDTA